MYVLLLHVIFLQHLEKTRGQLYKTVAAEIYICTYLVKFEIALDCFKIP
jgi:hypothetical protein